MAARLRAATAAVDALVANGRLMEEAVDDHDVRKHYANGAELVDDWKRSDRQPIGRTSSELREIRRQCVTRERCRLRRLRVRRS